ncbi:MAG: hypothetical protein QMD86_02865 [Patescibacteria group bacterium]|nr:hypothetical protein [Patescibacteria group bacterium]
MENDLFKDVKINKNQDKIFPHKRQCQACLQWYDTLKYYGDRCSEHLDFPTTKKKIEAEMEAEDDLPFRNFNRLKRIYE